MDFGLKEGWAMPRTRGRRLGWRHSLAALVGIGFLESLAVAHGSALPSGQAQATAASGNPEIATLEAVRGGVAILRLGLPQEALPSMPLQLNDIVVTKQGRATVRIHSDGTLLRIGPDSHVQINETAGSSDVVVFFGRLWAHVVRQRRLSRFRGGAMSAAIRGTEVSLAVSVEGDESRLSVLEGQVEAETDAGNLMLSGGESAVGRRGSAPRPGVGVRPQDAVQWALYYVPVIYFETGDLAEGPWRASVRESTEAYRAGDLQGAIDRLASVDVQALQDPRIFTYRASLLLATGSVDAATTNLEQALKLVPNDSDALALQSIIAVANNDTDNAFATARRAIEANPKSASARIALSYASQARFDLEGARESLSTAVELDPMDALAWARLAEIRSSQGYLDEALAAAKKAVELEPSLSRTRTVLGYAYLTRVQTREAREAFQKAIGLDGDDPLPRLGLGLARIRDGELTEGSRDIEVAVSLDPAASVVRSYLGKAYFEARRASLDKREYDVAKDSDPNDPTPWFYGAIAEQTTNRPVEALQSLEKAIELNDNRAVYRSRLLLDSDLAARSASLGRVYSDLGFQELALVEGWSSVNVDPSDYSAHRLLADSYATLPRHEIARVSELFQSQMLQPLNTTPIQPRLGESNLFLLGAQGPGALAFNEFNPLFNRDHVNVQGNFLVGEDDTLSGEAIVSGIYRKFSFSAGYSGFGTDGFRENNDQKDHLATVFAQAELSSSTSVQAEYRYRDNEYGDLAQRFFPDDFSSSQRNTEQKHYARVGVRHAFAPGSILLGSLTYEGDRLHFQDQNDVLMLAANLPRTAIGSELQHLFRSSHINLTTGLGYFNIDARLDARIVLDPNFIPPPDNVLENTLGLDSKHLNAYAYSYINPLEQVTLTAGVSGDFLSGDPEALVGEQGEVNPKFGISWRPRPGTTLRGAAFRAVRRTLIADQTLEPTQVAGFNQFYDDSTNGTRAWRYGGAIDQKFTAGLFAGAEYSKRDLGIPFLTLGEDETVPEVETEEANEQLVRAYLFSTPHPQVALRAEYLFERSESQGFTFLPAKLDTHRVPLGIRFFYASGFTVSVTTTYFNQYGDLVRFSSVTGEDIPQSGSDEFWTVDAGISYRLPNRYGFLAVGGTNLLDEKFHFFHSDIRNPLIQPTRRIVARITLAF